MPVLQDFVDDLRAGPKTARSVRDTLARYIARSDEILTEAPLEPGEETHLFEDSTLSVWNCCFAPHVAVPAHEHLMPVHIGSYHGVERNILLTRGPDGLTPSDDLHVKAGEMVSLDADCIHAVVGGGDQVSCALHVYMGPLMQIDRGLFDWNTGHRLPFTMDAFHRLTRPLDQLGLAP